MPDHESIRRLRAHAQALAGGACQASAVTVVRRVFAIQAQDATAADLGIRVRGRDITARAELTERLTTLGIPPDGQAPFYLIRHAALTGILCHGPQRAGEATHVLLDDWLPSTGRFRWEGDDALAELARRYLAAHEGLHDSRGLTTWAATRARQTAAPRCRRRARPGASAAPSAHSPVSPWRPRRWHPQ
ncbi:hypothetical protein [Streptomyces sp. NPDC050121]|uniref:hypothetical protein n=1 Tax=Streptomyces sp. NPDC050121 TaxID=3365601 RepID=UPI0037A1E605